MNFEEWAKQFDLTPDEHGSGIAQVAWDAGAAAERERCVSILKNTDLSGIRDWSATLFLGNLLTEYIKAMENP